MGHDFNPRSPDGERQSGLLVLGLAVDISIHAPRMGSNRGWDEILDQCLCISIHAPRMGSDQVRLVSRQSLKDFNPRSPDGERPNQLLTNPSSQGISIHAPRMGSDAGLALGGDTWPHISIHAPRMGSDHPDVDYLIVANQFQSTLPGWGATAKMDIFAHDMGKIIHFQH